MRDKPRDTDTASDEEHSDFLQRWSRRKLDTAQVPVVSTPTESVAQTQDESPPPREELSDADMPPLESLDEHADYSGFLSPKVSAELRRAALRKLFRAPRFNISDGLNDYDGDFRNYQALGEVITHEMQRALDREAQRLREQTHREDTPPPENELTESIAQTPSDEPQVAQPGAHISATDQDDETPA